MTVQYSSIVCRLTAYCSLLTVNCVNIIKSISSIFCAICSSNSYSIFNMLSFVGFGMFNNRFCLRRNFDISSSWSGCCHGKLFLFFFQFIFIVIPDIKGIIAHNMQPENNPKLNLFYFFAIFNYYYLSGFN